MWLVSIQRRMVPSQWFIILSCFTWELAGMLVCVIHLPVCLFIISSGNGRQSGRWQLSRHCGSAETVWKEHLSVSELICRDTCIQCQTAIHRPPAHTNLFLNSQTTEPNFKILINFEFLFLYFFLPLFHLHSLNLLRCSAGSLQCSSQLACHSSVAGMLSDTNQCSICCGNCLYHPAVLTHICQTDRWASLSEWD